MALHSRFLLASIFHTFVVPLLGVSALHRLSLLPFKNRYLVGLSYLASIPLLDVVSSAFKSRARAKDAKRLGARPVPRIKGKLPGNIDILWELVMSEPHEYCTDTLRNWSEKYGPTFDLNILWAHQIVTVDPENVKHVLATSFNSFEKSQKFHDMFEAFLGEGIFSTDGEAWKRHRAIARPFFVHERISDSQCFERYSEKVVASILQSASHNEPFDIQELFQRFTLDAGTDFLFGSCVNSLDNGVHDLHDKFTRAFNTVSTVGADRVRIGSTWPLFELFGDRMKKPMKVINAFVDPILEEAMKKRGLTEEMKDRTFLDHLIRETDDAKLIRDELLNILLAARDTTAALLTFVAYALALHPEVTAAVRKEIHEVIGESRPPNPADIRSMKYLRAVINEVLRLFPSVPFNIRRSTESSALPSPLSGLGPLYMPARVSITYSPFIIQRRTDLWGESALEFKPSRWLDDSLQAKTHVSNPFAFLPFNGGPRMCLGQQLAYHEVSYLIIKILQRVQKIELAPEAQPPDSLPPTDKWMQSEGANLRHELERCWIKSSLTLYSKGGLWIRATAAD